MLKTAWNKLKYFKPREIFLPTEYPGTIEESFQYTDLQSRFWPTYYQFFCSCCQETENFLANLCFKRREHSVQTADDNIKVISQAFWSTLVLYIFKLVLHYNWIIISNQIKYCLPMNRDNFLQIQYGSYRDGLQIHY